MHFLRGVEDNLSFINQIFLIVQNESEVPSYVNKNNVKIILHKDFIPQEYLPTFNSNTIETFLYRIEGLSEHFIYSNDDMFALNPLTVQNFFPTESTAITNFSHFYPGRRELSFFLNTVVKNNAIIFKKSEQEIRERKGAFQPIHTMRPYFKSLYQECYESNMKEVEKGITRFRAPFNYSLYMVDLYQLQLGRTIVEEPFAHQNIMNNISDVELQKILQEDCYNTICIIDHFPEVDIFENILLQNFFKQKFYKKSKYEV